MSTTTLQPDRDYWRCCDNQRLIDEARDSGHELSIALGERLRDTDSRALSQLRQDVRHATARAEAIELELDDIRLDDERLRRTNARLEDELAKAEDILRRFAVAAGAHSEHVGHIFSGIARETWTWLDQHEKGAAHGDA